MENNLSDRLLEELEKGNRIAFSHPAEAYKISMKVYDISKLNGLKHVQGISLIILCLACRSMAHIKEWLVYSYEALQIFQELGDYKRQLHSLNLISIAYFYSSVYDQALKHSLQALELAPQANAPYLLTCVLNNLGEIYMEFKKIDQSIYYFNEALELSKKEGFTFNFSYIQKNIGEIYFLKNDFETALDYFILSYEGSLADNDMLAASDSEIKIGNVYFELNHYSDAKTFYKNALDRLEAIDSLFYTIDALIGLGKIHLKKHTPQAIIYLEKALKYATSIHCDKKLSLIYEMLTAYYESIHNFELSLKHFKEYIYYKEKVDAQSIGYRLEVIQFELTKLKHSSKLTEFKQLNAKLEEALSLKEDKLKKLKDINKTLTQLAHYDKLTKLANRNLLMPSIDSLWQSALDTQQTLLFFMIDIDKFKSFNDFWGHLKGDECLVSVADALSHTKSPSPYLVGRYGGEEFIFCLKNINYEEAFILGEQIRTSIESLHIKYTNSPCSSDVTISLGGILGKPTHLHTLSEALELADRQLYISKETGRNKLTLHSFI